MSCANCGRSDVADVLCKSCQADGWIETEDGEIAQERQDDRDEAYERAAARARANDFEDTDGKDWT